MDCAEGRVTAEQIELVRELREVGDPIRATSQYPPQSDSDRGWKISNGSRVGRGEGPSDTDYLQ